MAHQRPSSHFGEMEYQQQGWGGRRNQRGGIENRQPANVIQGDIHSLGSLLEMERARWFEENQKVAALEKELEDAKLEVKRQKNLKEMYINKGKETKRELMRVEKFSDPETLSPAIIASKVHSDMKYRKKKLLQQDFEHLKVAYAVNEKLFVEEMQAEKEKNNTLQQELDKIKLSYEQLRSEREAENAGVTLQVDMQKVYEDKIKQDQTLIENLRAEKDDLFQTMSYEITVLQEKKKCLKSEMEELKVLYQELNLKYETEVSALRQQAEAQQHEMNHEKEAHSERAKNDLQLINDLKAEKESLQEKITQEFGFLQQQSAENIKHLQRELEQVMVSYQELKTRYDLDVSTHRQKAEVFEQELNQQIKAHSQKMRDNLKFIDQLGAEKDDLFQTMSYEITVLQEKKKCLKSEMEELKVSYQDLNLKYETEVSALRQQAEAQQHEMNREKEAHSERAKNDLQLINDLKAEKDSLQQKITQEFGFLQQQSAENIKHLQRELEQVMVSYQELKTRYDLDVSTHRQQAEVFEQELNQQIKAHSQKMRDNLKFIDQLGAEKDDLFQTMSYEITVLQEKKKCLKSEMEELKVSYQELNLKYETEVSALRQQAEAQQHEMNREKEAHSERAKNDLQLINDLKAEKESLQEKITQEFGFLQQQSAENIKHLQRELEQVMVSYQELKTRYDLDVSTHRQQAEVFEQELNQQIKAHSQKMRDNLKFIDQLGAEKDALHQELTVLQQRFSGCKTELENLKAELQDRDELGPQKRKRARRQEPSCQNESIGDPASMDLDHLLDEMLSEPVECPEASPKELDNFVDELLRDLSILDSEPMKVTELSEKTLPENQESQDPEPMKVGGSQQEPSVWKKIRHTLGLKKPKKWKKSMKTSK